MKPPLWSDEDLQILRELYPSMGAQVRFHLSVPRSVLGIRRKAQELEIVRGYDRLAQVRALEAIKELQPIQRTALAKHLNKGIKATEAIVRKLKDRGLVHSVGIGCRAYLIAGPAPEQSVGCELQECWK